MHFDLKRPCHNCPFRRIGHIPLTAGRVREIAGMMLSTAGGTFGCHTHRRFHCAGALIFAERQGNATQMMRIAERLGIYDSRALLADASLVDLVFESQAEMLRAHAAVNRRRRKAP